MKIGRSALDEDAIREIEQNNPDVEFDWTRILKGQAAPEDARDRPQGRGGERDRGERGDRSERPDRGDRAERGDRRDRGDRSERAEPERERRAERPGGTADRPRGPRDRHEAPTPAPVPRPESVDAADLAQTASAEERASSPEGPESYEAAGIDNRGELDRPVEPHAADLPARETWSEAPTPAHARLGSEGVSRLRARHAEILARISERVQDAAQQEQLKSAAERLNPDTWVTDEEVQLGLEQYEPALEAIRAVVGQRRRRRRSRRAERAPQQQDMATSGPEEAPDPEPDAD